MELEQEKAEFLKQEKAEFLKMLDDPKFADAFVQHTNIQNALRNAVTNVARYNTHSRYRC